LTGRYIHQELNQEIAAIGGHYALVREVRLPFRCQELLYLVGYAALDTACCGVGGCSYALVPGFVLSWKRDTEDGLPVSEIEPVRDEAIQREIRQLIEGAEMVGQVRFL
jgi:hypothetical protein